MLMYYVNCYTFLEEPEKDWAKMIQEAKEIPPEPSLFVTIQFRPSCNQTKNPEVIPGIFCIGMAEVV